MGRERSSGFVLVSVLLLLALVTVLVVSTLLISQIERRAAAQSAKTESARQNALFALDVALNQLQKEAGPDQRITARADILDSTPSSSTIEGVNQPYWSGVWKTGNASLDVGATPQRTTSLGSLTPTAADKAGKAAWLVSNPAPSTPISPLTWTGSTTGNSTTRTAVVMARRYGSSSATVSVPLVPVLGNASASTTNATGGYAYWVSDEGIKARANLYNPNLDAPTSSRLVESQLQFFAPSAQAVHKFLPSPFNIDFRGNATLVRVVTLPAIRWLTSSGATVFDAPEFEPDMTLYSAGVLADVRNGGLKKDLTAAFEDGQGAFSSGNMSRLLAFSNNLNNFTSTPNSGKVYAVTPISGSYFNGYANGHAIDGMRWMSLYNYYNLYKSSATTPSGLTASGTSPSGVGSPSASPILQVRNYNIDGNFEGTSNANRLIRDNISARVIGWQMHIGIQSYQDAIDSRWKIKLLMMPGLVLYNPYNVRLTHQSDFQYQWSGWYNLNAGFDTLQFALGSNTPANQFNINPLQNFSLSANGAQGDLGAGVTSNGFATAANAAITMEPGEIKIFGLNRVVDPAIGSDNFGTLQNFFSPDFYHAIDLKRIPLTMWSAGANTTNGTVFHGTASGADSVLLRRVFPRIRTNDGRFNAHYRLPNSSPNPATGAWNLWPQGGSTGSQYLTQMYLNDITVTPLASPLNLGPISSLTQPIKFMTYTVWMKGTNSAQDLDGSGTIVARPAPVFASAGSLWNPIGTDIRNPPIDLQVSVGRFPMDKASLNSTPGPASSVRSYWGDSVTGGETQIVLKEVPRQPLISLGQFMHSNPSYNPNRSGSVLRSATLYPVGGSWASSFVPRDKAVETSLSGINTGFNTVGEGGSNVTAIPIGGPIQCVDDSFLANQALFDTYFFSTVPSLFQQSNNSLYPPRNTVFDSSYVASGNPLPNSRHRFYSKNGVNPQISALRDFDRAAASLMLEGAFNVNSTSVNAWVALLSSLSNNRLLATDGTEVSLNGLNPIPRFLHPLYGGTTSVNTPWGGVRALTDAEVRELAEKIVEQVKNRGPFLSMADFLNRRLVANGTNGLYGALQAALEASSVNNAVKAAVGRTTDIPSSTVATAILLDTTSLPSNTATGVPGYLMQQDIVQCFAPLMSARSDTFVVRCYGESRNPATGTVEGKAWGECVIQRLPDYVDQADPALTSGASLGDAAPLNSLNTNNQNYGRRFKVISFRWLDPESI